MNSVRGREERHWGHFPWSTCGALGSPDKAVAD